MTREIAYPLVECHPRGNNRDLRNLGLGDPFVPSNTPFILPGRSIPLVRPLTVYYILLSQNL